MMMRRMMMLTLSIFVFTGLTAAVAGEPEPALNGNCPVCLVKANKLVKGDVGISSIYDGRTYLFPSAEQKRTFDANPAAFVPALGGDCVVCKKEMGKDVTGKPEFHAVHNGRLYLFPSNDQKRTFERAPGKYADTDLALNGKCPVCLVKKNKVVDGKEEYASVYDGRRYLFPGPEQKRMFDANPAAFAPAMVGNCVVCKIEKGQDVPGNPESWLTHNGRLYLFPSEKQREMFIANPDRYADADVALDGYCPVCKVELGKDVKGKWEIAVDYKGKRFLFPGNKQRDMFLADPNKYTID